jgi:ABC-type polysaccharide/polyol phosphate transport system ATPase subunit
MKPSVIVLEEVNLFFPRQKSFVGIITNFFKKTRPPFHALKNITINIEEGEVLGIIGKNGSGKSTLLRVISGIYPADTGNTFVKGDVSLLAGLGTGFSRHQTGKENAILFGSILGHGEEEMLLKLPEIVEFSELGDFINEPIRTYSAGMKARLGLAVASAIRPNILLIDEVLGVGDPKFREKSKRKIMEMVKEAGTVIIVSHSFGLMKEICNRVVLMHNGKIHTVGEPSKAIDAYNELVD